MAIDQTIGDRLRKARGLTDLTQAEVARRAGLQPSAVAHFESDRRAPCAENLRKLAKALDVSQDWLNGGST